MPVWTTLILAATITITITITADADASCAAPAAGCKAKAAPTSQPCSPCAPRTPCTAQTPCTAGCKASCDPCRTCPVVKCHPCPQPVNPCRPCAANCDWCRKPSACCDVCGCNPCCCRPNCIPGSPCWSKACRHSTCDLYPHFAYPPQCGGYYYFRAYNWIHIDQHRLTIPGNNLKDPYSNKVFDDLYAGKENLGDRDSDQPKPVHGSLPKLEDLLK